jgi:hypothetical protein
MTLSIVLADETEVAQAPRAPAVTRMALIFMFGGRGEKKRMESERGRPSPGCCSLAFVLQLYKHLIEHICMAGHVRGAEISLKLQEVAILRAHCVVVGGHHHTFQIEEV